jgi:hypothetical protein
MVRLRNRKYIEHWGINTLPTVLQQLAKNWAFYKDTIFEFLSIPV